MALPTCYGLKRRPGKMFSAIAALASPAPPSETDDMQSRLQTNRRSFKDPYSRCFIYVGVAASSALILDGSTLAWDPLRRAAIMLVIISPSRPTLIRESQACGVLSFGKTISMPAGVPPWHCLGLLISSCARLGPRRIFPLCVRGGRKVDIGRRHKRERDPFF